MKEAVAILLKADIATVLTILSNRIKALVHIIRQCMPDPRGLRSIRVQGCAAREDSFHNTAYFVDRLSLQRKCSAPVGG
jgi:hypothetical protein